MEVSEQVGDLQCFEQWVAGGERGLQGDRERRGRAMSAENTQDYAYEGKQGAR